MSPTPSQPSAASPAEWFVQVDGTDYGPFTAETLWSYMQEGRVNAQSFVRRGASGGFAQVTNMPALAGWLRTLASASAQPASAKPAAARPAPVQAMRVSLVMAEIRSGRAMAFLQTLQSLGGVQRIGDTVWLLRSPHAPDTLCEVLAGPLMPEDRMFVLDASEADSSAFNLGRSVDQGLQSIFKPAD